MNALTHKTASKTIPTTVYAQGEKLFVHTGAGFQVIAAVGAIGKVDVAGNYPVNFGVKADTRWTQDGAGIARFAATAINAYPVLTSRVNELQARQADLVAKLKLAKVALERRDTLSAGYVEKVLGEIDRSLTAAQAR
jgi:hypothetical protein